MQQKKNKAIEVVFIYLCCFSSRYHSVLFLSTGECQSSISDAIEYDTNVRSISSPNYPSDYAFNLNCYWVLSVPSGLIEITFEDFYVPDSDDLLLVSICIFNMWHVAFL